MILSRSRAAVFLALEQTLASLKTSALTAASERLTSTLASHDMKAERAIANAQILIAVFILVLHVISLVKSGGSSGAYFVPCVLAAIILSSTIRLILIDLARFTEHAGDGLTVVDISLFLLLIWCFQFPYDLPASSSLKAPSFVFLCVLVAMRVFRLHPRPVMVAGASAVLGWVALALYCRLVGGEDAVANTYVEHLATHRILVGAELERISALLFLTTFLAIAAGQARQILNKAAHSDDYLDALTKSEKNLRELQAAREETESAVIKLQSNARQLASRNERFNQVLENMGEGICMFDGDKRLVVSNGLYRDWYQLPENLVQPGTPHADIIAHRVSNGILNGETSAAAVQEKIASLENHSKVSSSKRVDQLADGRFICVTREPLEDGGWVATHQDITEEYEAREKISHMALHDPLTNLPNRSMLNARLDEALARTRRGEKIALHLLDLDHFKNVNDTLGHPIGDKLLLAVSDRLKQYSRETDTISRMGGDEFAVVQTMLDRPEDAEILAERIIETVSAPYDIDGHSIVIGTSVGVAVAPNDGSDAVALTRNADLALYRAKSSGRGAFSFFEPEMDAKMQARRTLEYELRRGLVKGEFELYYQPTVRLADEQVSGFEALVRWNHPTRGLLSPGSFISLAEETGFIKSLGEWIINEACHTAALWPEDLTVAVNISAVQCRDMAIVDQVFDALDTSGLQPSRLMLEITESVLLGCKDTTLAILSRLQEKGIRIAMDDFGTGYSSLSYLQSFPFDKIKIDRAFVANANDDKGAINIVRAITLMAEGMNISTTAEGVESADQVDRMKSEGISEMQGYFISKPIPAREVMKRFVSKRTE